MPTLVPCRYVLLALNGLLVAKEVFQLAHGWRAYVHHWENWLQLLIVASVFLCDIPSGQVSPGPGPGQREQPKAQTLTRSRCTLRRCPRGSTTWRRWESSSRGWSS